VTAGPHDNHGGESGMNQPTTLEAASKSRVQYDRTTYDEEVRMEVRKD
jgi:hypothetical protein